MRLLSGHNTMRNARPKFRDPNDGIVVRTIEQIRAEKLRERYAAANREAIRKRDEAVAEAARRADEYRQQQEARLRREAQDEAMRPIRETRAIARRLCRVMGVTRRDVESESRAKRVVFCRQAIMYWAMRRTGISMVALGRLLGGRDHTTILHGVKVYPKKRAEQGRYLRPIKR